ncbi:MAG: NUDIX hydrolase, partial [Betaproteobacteria bacterium]|nr:NUDIX hydrolase [Betaproteobacteria bacterium]
TAMQAIGPASIEALVSVVYADVPVGLHPVARRSLLAHLLKLQADGRARVDAEVWALMH